VRPGKFVFFCFVLFSFLLFRSITHVTFVNHYMPCPCYQTLTFLFLSFSYLARRVITRVRAPTAACSVLAAAVAAAAAVTALAVAVTTVAAVVMAVAVVVVVAVDRLLRRRLRIVAIRGRRQERGTR
jgi:hypothetical protein